MKTNNTSKDIETLLNESGRKNNLYLVYYLAVFVLFASLAAFDIATFFMGEPTSTSKVNLVFGIIFGVLGLIGLTFLVLYLIKPKQIISIDFKNSKLIISKTRSKKRELSFNEIYFLKENSLSITSFVLKGSNLKIYTKDGECISLKCLSNAHILKKALDTMLNLREKNIYQKHSIKIFFIRIYQYLFKFIFRFVHHKEAKLLNSYEDIATSLKSKNISKVLLVESKTITKKLLDNYLKTTLENNNIQFVSFSDIDTNPTITNCEEGKNVYKKENCEAIITLGGGSVMDCAKGIALLINSKKPLAKYKGAFKIHHKVPLIVAIPTTCGTGSETTFVTVISDKDKGTKFAITSNKIVPTYAYLDANLIKDLPLHFIGTTALDAFTHALESYLNISRDRKSKKYSIEAMKLIYQNLLKAKEDPSNLTYKENLLKASYIAGNAFSRGLVGPIHALSHALGGKYDLGHGYLNSILLPRFLNVYLFSCYKDLNNIAKEIGLSNCKDMHKNAKNFVNYLTLLNQAFDFKQELDILNSNDIKLLAETAYKESHLLYSSKHFVSKEMYEDILVSLLRN